MLKLKRLKVLHYRNVAPGCELRFDDGINLVLGQNASGKTTLLALISAVCRSSFAGIKDEEFELEYEIESERFRISAKVSHRREAISEEDSLIGTGPLWNDNFEVDIINYELNAEFHLRSTDEPRPSVDFFMEWSFIAALLVPHGRATADLRVAVTRDYSDAFRFDESLDCFASMTGRTSALPGPATPPLARVAFSAHSRSSNRIVVGPFAPRSFVLGFGPGAREQTPISSKASEPFKLKLTGYLTASNVDVHTNIREQRISGDERTYQIEGFTFQITRPDGTTIHHDRLSYGQKRLLAFLYYLECNPAVVIADELVNGLHHRWIDACMNELGERQAFLTSQNPLLFDYATFDSVERVQSSFLICGLELRDGREEMVWRNMSRDDAQVFFDAYQAGVEHVGDILITRGLW